MLAKLKIGTKLFNLGISISLNNILFLENEDIIVPNQEQENEESVENTELPLDLSIATNRSQPPSGSQQIYSSSSASQPRNTKRVNIQGSDRGNTTTWSEYSIHLPGSHLPTYEEHIQSQTPSRRVGNMQLVGNSPRHINQFTTPSATSVGQSVRSLPNFSQINQVLDQQTLSLNENLQSAVRDNASTRNITHLYPPDIFMVPFQLSLPNMHQHYVLPRQQAFTLTTYNQNVHPLNIQTDTQTDNSQFYASYYTSAENQSRCNLTGLFTQPTHSHISQNVLLNQQADEILSAPSTLQRLPTDVSGLASTYYSKLSTYYVLTIIIL